MTRLDELQRDTEVLSASIREGWRDLAQDQSTEERALAFAAIQSLMDELKAMLDERTGQRPQGLARSLLSP